jgi:hypothetical protein
VTEAVRVGDSAGPDVARVVAHRPVRAVDTTRPEKQTIGSCQCGTTPDTARHERSIEPHRAGLLSVGLFRASAGLGPGGPFGNLYNQVV